MSKKNENYRVFDETIELTDNAMLRHRPELLNEWNFEKNEEIGLDVYKVTIGSSKIANWICESGHESAKSIKNYCKAIRGCIECSTSRFRLGVNDLWTSSPDTASLLLNREDGYRLFKSTQEKVDWKCVCGEIIRNKGVSSVVFTGLKCPICSDGFSYPEKILYHLLSQLNLEFECEKVFTWSQSKRYDFYLLQYGIIIEVHGIQHYEKRVPGRNGFKYNLLEQQENDKLKEELAKEYGIKEYIIIDARHSRISHIKDSILKSKLPDIFDMNSIDYKDISKKASTSLHIEILNLWNSGRGIEEISKKVRIGKQTITSALKKFEEVGLCVYDGYRHLRINYKVDNQKIRQTDSSGKILAIYNSYDEINKKLNYNKYYIHQVCIGKKDSYKGFIWEHILT